MVNYIISRLLQGALVIFLISIVTFVIMRMLPGDLNFLIELLVGCDERVGS